MFGSSQGLSFGASGYAPEASQDVNTPEKRTRQEDKQTCMPLTVRLIQDAAASTGADGTDLKIHGAELVNIALVGVVEGLVEQATGLEFVLNDSSGRIKVRYYQSGDGSTTNLTAGCYVSIVGSLRMTPMLHVSALSARLVKSADEVSYHMIEVAHAALKLKSGGSRAPDATSTPEKQMTASLAPNDLLTPPKASQDVVPTVRPTPTPVRALSASEPLTGSALKNAVLEFFRTEGEGKDEGLSVSNVAAHMKATPPESIKVVVQELVTDGELFTTIDDDHFSAL
jgi:hypothetical protein